MSEQENYSSNSVHNDTALPQNNGISQPSVMAADYVFVPGFGFMPQTPEQRERREISHEIRNISIAMLAYFAIYLLLRPMCFNIIALILRKDMAQILSNSTLFYTVNSVFYTVALVIPFLAYKSSTGMPMRVVFCHRRTTPSIAVGSAAILLGVTGLGYFASAATATVLTKAGISFAASSAAVPKDLGGFIAFLFTAVAIPVFFEEVVFRGVVLQSLRRFGDGFALIVSSVLFALLHCNVWAIPRAFLSGLVIGYFVLRSGSVLLGVLIHFVNNTLAVAFDLLTSTMSAAESQLAGNILMASYIILGFVFLLIMLKNNNNMFRIMPPDTVLADKSKFGIFFGSAGFVIIAIVVAYYCFWA